MVRVHVHPAPNMSDDEPGGLAAPDIPPLMISCIL